MTNLKNHAGYWLAADAAASLSRFEAKHGIIPITSAGRTEAEQQGLINRWAKGGSANRPPRLYQPASPAKSSRHVANGGKAIDTAGNGIALMHKYGEDHGWFFNFAYDLVHFEYDAARDKYRGVVGASTGAKPIGFSQIVANQQNWLKYARKEKLIVDGIDGPNTVAARKRYQTFLRKYGYKGAIDGVWGKGTEAAHDKYYAAFHKK